MGLMPGHRDMVKNTGYIKYIKKNIYIYTQSIPSNNLLTCYSTNHQCSTGNKQFHKRKNVWEEAALGCPEQAVIQQEIADLNFSATTVSNQGSQYAYPQDISIHQVSFLKPEATGININSITSYYHSKGSNSY